MAKADRSRRMTRAQSAPAKESLHEPSASAKETGWGSGSDAARVRAMAKATAMDEPSGWDWGSGLDAARDSGSDAATGWGSDAARDSDSGAATGWGSDADWASAWEPVLPDAAWAPAWDVVAVDAAAD